MARAPAVSCPRSSRSSRRADRGAPAGRGRSPSDEGERPLRRSVPGVRAALGSVAGQSPRTRRR
ncbi:hypothetical protein ADL27_34135 [Streptomyces sp. NRRL F-6602]|nr:hypothetical protein ADL27_34135 [Streptomyces sp. NRRL F-6602]